MLSSFGPELTAGHLRADRCLRALQRSGPRASYSHYRRAIGAAGDLAPLLARPRQNREASIPCAGLTRASTPATEGGERRFLTNCVSWRLACAEIWCERPLLPPRLSAGQAMEASGSTAAVHCGQRNDRNRAHPPFTPRYTNAESCPLRDLAGRMAGRLSWVERRIPDLPGL